MGKGPEEISDRLVIKTQLKLLKWKIFQQWQLNIRKDSSMVVGFKMLKEAEGDVFISAGNSGALLTGATLLVGRIKGIDRPAFGWNFCPHIIVNYYLWIVVLIQITKPINLVSICANVYNIFTEILLE